MAGRSAPAQVVGQQTTVLQEFDGFQSVIGRPQCRHGRVPHAGFQRPGRSEAGQRRLGLGKADSIIAAVRRCAGGKRDRAIGYDFGDQIGDLANPVVLAGLADVERLIVNGLAQGSQRGSVGVDDVADVNQRSPRRAVALQQHLAGRDGMANEVVDDDVGSQSSRHAVGGDRVERRRFVKQTITSRPVQTARR